MGQRVKVFVNEQYVWGKVTGIHARFSRDKNGSDLTWEYSIYYPGVRKTKRFNETVMEPEGGETLEKFLVKEKE